MTVGVFDSGIGGLTVLKSLVKKHPNNKYIYFGDTLNMPYGERPKDELNNLSADIVDFLISKNVDIIVIACGTISSNSLEYLKSKYNIPIYDVLTPTIEYLKNNNLENLAVIATSMTIKSNIFDQIDGICQIECPKFVPLIENNLIASKEMEEAINEYIKGKKIKNLVLGCTHYPLLTKRINEVLNDDINYINMGDILAASLNLIDTKNGIEFYFSKMNDNIPKIVKEMFDLEIK